MLREDCVQPIVPHLTVRDAAAAIAFYHKAFSAIEESRMPAKDGKRLLHAVLTVNGASIFLADEFPEHGGVAAPKPGETTAAAVALQLGAPGQVDATFSKAVEAGAKGTMPPADMFWGARFAMLQDPFGHRWMLNAPLPKT